MKFEKVSAAQFAADCDAAGFAVEYANVVMPRRATKGSAGYDICIPFDVVLAPHTSVKVPTGIRCTGMPRNVVMTIYIRSSVGIKRGVRFMNLLPVVDSDYADSPTKDTSGLHFITIAIKMQNSMLANELRRRCSRSILSATTMMLSESAKVVLVLPEGLDKTKTMCYNTI